MVEFRFLVHHVSPSGVHSRVAREQMPGWQSLQKGKGEDALSAQPGSALIMSPATSTYSSAETSESFAFEGQQERWHIWGVGLHPRAWRRAALSGPEGGRMSKATGESCRPIPSLAVNTPARRPRRALNNMVRVTVDVSARRIEWSLPPSHASRPAPSTACAPCHSRSFGKKSR